MGITDDKLTDSQQGELELRQFNERLISEAGRLKGRDRVWVLMHLKNGSSINQIARLSGVSPSTVSRRIRRTVALLSGGRYLSRLKYSRRLSPVEIQIAEDNLVRGLSMRQIARNHRLSYYRVRMTIKRIRTMLASFDNHRQQSAPRGA